MMQVRKVRLSLLTSTLLLSMICPVVLAQSADQARRLDSCRMLSYTVLKLLRQELGKGAQHETVDFLEKNLTNPSLTENFFVEVRRRAFNGCGFTLLYRSAPTSSPISQPTLYVFLPNSDQQSATLASYRLKSDPSVSALPREIREFLGNQNADTNSIFNGKNRSSDTVVTYSGDSLATTFPALSREKFVIFSMNSRLVTHIVEVQFDLWEFGPNQIRARFADSLPGAVFTVPAANSAVIPKSASTANPNRKQLLARQEVVSEFSAPGEDLVFIGSNSPVPVTLNGLWDSDQHIWIHLDAEFGTDWGNESPLFVGNYVLDYGGSQLLLRVAKGFAEAIWFGDSNCTTFTVADETAPEL